MWEITPGPLPAWPMREATGTRNTMFLQEPSQWSWLTETSNWPNDWSAPVLVSTLDKLCQDVLDKQLWEAGVLPHCLPATRRVCDLQLTQSHTWWTWPAAFLSGMHVVHDLWHDWRVQRQTYLLANYTVSVGWQDCQDALQPFPNPLSLCLLFNNRTCSIRWPLVVRAAEHRRPTPSQWSGGLLARKPPEA